MSAPVRYFTYLVEAENGRLKIGRTRWPEDRIPLVISGNAAKTRLIALFEADASHRGEKIIQQRFAAFRLWGEWFEITGDLAAYVESIRGHGIARVADWSEQSAEATVAKRQAAIDKATESCRQTRLRARESHPHGLRPLQQSRDANCSVGAAA